MTRVARSESRVTIGERADGSVITLPVMRWHGEEGPHLYIGISIHGDEITGQASLWRVGAWLEQSVLTGTVTAVPVQNPEGFNYSVRGIPGRTVDPNRAYPGDAHGETMERVTAAVTRIAREADAAIDVHTAGWCIPYLLMDPVADAALAARTEELARATGITMVGEFVSERYEATGLAASLPPVVLAAGKPAFTFELAGHGNVAWEQAEAGAVGMRNAIRHLGIVRDEREVPRDVVVKPTAGHHRRAVLAERGGIVEFNVRPGDDVTKGRRIGRIRDVWGRVVEEVLAPAEGFVIGLSPVGATWTGGYLAELAVLD
ncbi:MAG: succinylglutamate desuccinylase/aspartoacylase family protein [Candidatus Eisenbacteria bacterium]